MTFCFAQPEFRCKNQPWLANFLPASQGFTEKSTLAKVLHFIPPGSCIIYERNRAANGDSSGSPSHNTLPTALILTVLRLADCAEVAPMPSLPPTLEFRWHSAFCRHDFVPCRRMAKQFGMKRIHGQRAQWRSDDNAHDGDGEDNVPAFQPYR